MYACLCPEIGNEWKCSTQVHRQVKLDQLFLFVLEGRRDEGEVVGQDFLQLFYCRSQDLHWRVTHKCLDDSKFSVF